MRNIRLTPVANTMFHVIMTAGPFRQHGHLGAQVVSPAEIALALTVFVQAFVIGDDSGNPLPVIEDIFRRSLREYGDSCPFH